MSFILFYIIHVILHHSCHFMSFHVISCHVIYCHVVSFHVISCHFMSFHVISCHFMSLCIILCHYRSFHVSLDFSDQLSVKSGRGRAGAGAGAESNIFLGLRRHLCCLAEGKKPNMYCAVCTSIVMHHQAEIDSIKSMLQNRTNYE
jgi:hypothetical protein